MQAGEDNIVIYQGCFVRVVYELTNSDGSVYDLEGWSSKGQIRNQPGGTLIADWITEIDIENGLLILELELEVSNEIPMGNSVWDVVLTNPSGEPYKYVKGMITKEATNTVL